MTSTIPQRELRNDNARVIEAVVAGETFVITRNGVPVPELRPIVSSRKTFLPKSELMALAAKAPSIDRARFQADLDGLVDQSL